MSEIHRTIAYENLKGTIDTSTWPVQPEFFPKHLNPFEYLEKKFLTPKDRADNLRANYPKEFSGGDDTILQRFVDNDTGVRSRSDGIATYWQVRGPNLNYAGKFLIVATAGELRKERLDIRVDVAAGQDSEEGVAVIAISDYPRSWIPGKRFESVGWASRSPVYKNEKGLTVDIDGNPVDQAWKDVNGRMHFPDEE